MLGNLELITAFTVHITELLSQFQEGKANVKLSWKMLGRNAGTAHNSARIEANKLEHAFFLFLRL